MLVACSGNRQTFQQIQTGSSSPAQNEDVSGYSVCARPRFCTGHPQGHEPVFIQALLPQPAVERLHCGIVRGRSRS